MDAYADARARFTRLGELGTVGIYWHQTGIAYEHSGNPGAAEDAYREALAIKVRLDDVVGQASTLNQLGNLYQYVLSRPEESVALYRQAADLHVKIGDVANEVGARSNLGDALRRLGRLAEARLEVQRTIECGAEFGHASSPWATWANLADIETAAANSGAAAAARTQARAAYLAYRRDSGENHYPSCRIALAVTERLSARDPAAAQSLLRQVATDPKCPDRLRPFLTALEAIAVGSRDPALADAPNLHYTEAAEVLLLIETLE